MKKMILGIIAFFMIIINVQAACSYTAQLDLNSKAANVKRSYELFSDVVQYQDGSSEVEYFIVTLMNITDDIYVEVTDDVYNNVKIFKYEDTNNGTATFNWTDTNTVTNFTIKIYAENDTECSGELLKTMRLTTPRFNNYYNRSICEGMEDFYLCQKYVTVDNINESEFISKIEGFMNGKIDEKGEEIKEEENKGVFSYINKYKWYIIGAVSVIGVVTGTFIYTKKAKKQREFGV